MLSSPKYYKYKPGVACCKKLYINQGWHAVKSKNYIYKPRVACCQVQNTIYINQGWHAVKSKTLYINQGWQAVKKLYINQVWHAVKSINFIYARGGMPSTLIYFQSLKLYIRNIQHSTFILFQIQRNIYVHISQEWHAVNIHFCSAQKKYIQYKQGVK